MRKRKAKQISSRCRDYKDVLDLFFFLSWPHESSTSRIRPIGLGGRFLTAFHQWKEIQLRTTVAHMLSTRSREIWLAALFLKKREDLFISIARHLDTVLVWRQLDVGSKVASSWPFVSATSGRHRRKKKSRSKCVSLEKFPRFLLLFQDLLKGYVATLIRRDFRFSSNSITYCASGFTLSPPL